MVSPAQNLLGIFRPLDTPVHRCPLWVKGLTLLALGVVLAVTTGWLPGAVCLALALLAGQLARIPLTTWGRALASLVWLLLVLGVYYVVSGKYAQGADVLLTLLTMVVAARVLLWSTPLPVIVDGFVALCAPVRLVGASPERIGLALALMVRSIPVILDHWHLIGQAVAARGIKVNQLRLFIPLVLATISYANDTGDALAARGLDK